jgi:predicted Fe-Mo cluster-binding NifX family protein
MRIAIPVDEDKGMDSVVSHHMGHAKVFLVYDSETKELSRVPIGEDKPGMCVPVNVLENEGIECVFLFEAGQRAIMKMQALAIKVVTGDCKTVRDVTESLDKLKPLEQGCGH